MIKVLITGAAGFIGSHLADACLAKGWQVHGVDNLATGKLSNISDKVVFHLLDIQSINDNNELSKIKFDYIFHLAALADIVPSIEKPKDYMNANIMGTIELLEFIRNTQKKLKKLVYAASSSCYGIPEEYPTDTLEEIDPQYPYAFSKYMAEQMISHYNDIYNIPFISLRLFNVYGIRQRTSGSYGAVFGVFLKQLLEHKPLTIVGDGEQKRDFIYVTDVCNAFVKAAQVEINDLILNVGSGTPQSINYLVELIGGKKVYIPKRPGEPDITWADIFKTKQILNWKPEISFKQGVDEMLRNINLWKDAPLWDKRKIKKATKSWFKYLKKC